MPRSFSCDVYFKCAFVHESIIYWMRNTNLKCVAHVGFHAGFRARCPRSQLLVPAASLRVDLFTLWAFFLYTAGTHACDLFARRPRHSNPFASYSLFT